MACVKLGAFAILKPNPDDFGDQILRQTHIVKYPENDPSYWRAIKL